MRARDVVVAGAVGVAVLIGGAPAAVGSGPAGCATRSQAQAIVNRHGISCAAARKAQWRVTLALAKSRGPRPECRGAKAVRVSGWRLTAAPRDDRWTPGTKYSRGRRSFVAVGGGSCF